MTATRYELYDGQGNLLEQYDNRTLEQAREQRIAEFRQGCALAIAASGATEARQLNALRLLSGLPVADMTTEEATAILDTVEACRARYHAARDAVNGAATNDAVDAVVW